MKRRLTKLAVFLLLGAIVNVAVAWGIANWGSIGTLPQRSLGDGIEGSSNRPRGFWQVQLNKRRGITRLESHYFVNPMGSFWITGTAAESLLPSWAEQRIEYEESDHHILLYAAGWPFRTLQCRVEFDQVSDGITLQERLNQPRSQSEQMPALPYGPIWPGFLLNTAFYAAVLWMLTLGPITARRIVRVKRGHCIKCDYDLRGAEHDVCPECGADGLL